MIWIKCHECDHDAVYEVVSRGNAWYLCDVCFVKKESDKTHDPIQRSLING